VRGLWAPPGEIVGPGATAPNAHAITCPCDSTAWGPALSVNWPLRTLVPATFTSDRAPTGCSSDNSSQVLIDIP
jgi:hypothetical protein